MEAHNRKIDEKFRDVPDDQGTIVLHSEYGKKGGFDVKFEFWTYSTYAGVSAIFLRKDVENLSHEEIIELVKKECETDKVQVTTPGESFLFVTYAVKDHSSEDSFY